VTPWEYFRTQPQVILHYLRVSVWPDVLCLDYMWPVADSAWEIYPAGLGVVLLLVVCMIGYWRRPQIAFLGLALFLILAPTSTFMPIRDLAVEHRMYLPLAALAAALVLLVDWLATRFVTDAAARKLLLVGGLVIVAIALAARTHVRNRDYMDPVRLWTKVLHAAPNNFRAHATLGAYALQRGDLKTAESHYRAAIQMEPTFPAAQLGYARLLAQLGRADDAEKHFRTAIELDPQYTLAIDSFGNYFARKRQFEEAMKYYQQAINAEPTFALAHLHLGMARLEKRDLAGAKAALETALELAPHLAAAKLGLARILASAPHAALRDGARAVQLAKQVQAQVSKPDATVLDVLAMAEAESRQFARAVQTVKYARHLALAADDQELVRQLDQREQLYRSNQAYRLQE
jgi:tetratricopeptide (TPR) repeat protein